MSAAIFVLTIILVIWQPRGLDIGWSAALGAALSLLSGCVSLSDIPKVWSMVWNASATLIGLIVLTLTLDEAGLFRWAAIRICRAAGGSASRLFVCVILFGALLAALIANDGAVLILTPVVAAVLAELALPRQAVIAFVMAAGFIADTASLPFTTSNLVNIITADFFGAAFGQYAAAMAPAAAASVAASLGVLWLRYRRWLPRRYDTARLPEASSAVADPLVFRLGLAVLAALPALCFAAGAGGIPVCAVTGSAAALLLAASRRRRVVSISRVLRQAPWQIVIFSLGMYLVVFGLRNEGLTSGLTQALEALASLGTAPAVFGTGVLAAALSSVMNNLPAVMTGVLSIESAGVPEAVRTAMFYANAIGCDLGPKITPIGSLATLLWLHVLAHKGLRVTWGMYIRTGIVLTAPVLLAALAALALTLG
ncbi:MAG: arsenical efflux pump membrane protein ArsB [Mesosutterella sp.]|nr:arsenical efflux pump membrane protein ArsB [Mesosutterella sp.]